MPGFLRSRRLTLFCIAVALLASTYASAGFATARFRRLTMEDGLSNNEVNTVIQDSRGYIWLSTVDGVDRYDGYSFRVFRHDPNDATSISGNFVRALYEDPEGRLWAGTYANGLNLYDPLTGHFKHYRHIAGDPDSLGSDSIWSLTATPDGKLLIGTYNAGLDIFDTKTGKFQHYPAGSGPSAPSSNHINKILLDSEGHAWLATSSGLDEFYLDGRNPTRHFKTPGGAESNKIVAIAEDKQHRLWLATTGGAYVYVPGRNAISEIPGIGKTTNPLMGKQLLAVFVDEAQNVWYGDSHTGLYIIRQGSDRIQNYQHEAGDTESLSSSSVWDIFKDKSGYIWLTTDTGVNMLDPDMLNVYSLKPSDRAGKYASISNLIVAMYQYHDGLLLGSVGGVLRFPLTSLDDHLTNDSNVFLSLDPKRYGNVTAISGADADNLLVGTELGSLLLVNPQGRILRSWRPSVGRGKLPLQIHRIVRHGAYDYYLATFGYGLLDFDIRTSSNKPVAGETSTELASNDLVEDLLRVSPDRLWAATFRGLFEINTQDNRSSLIPLAPGSNEPVIQGLYEDGQRNLWITTYDGLWHLRLDDKGDPVSRPEAVPQFRSMELLAIEPDNQGHLWLANVNSLIRFDPVSGAAMTFGRGQDSPMSEYYSYGHAHTSNGWLWFAGGQGAMGFLPRNLVPNRRPPEVVLNGATTYREGTATHVRLPAGQQLTLGYRDTITIFDAAATDYGVPQANTYSYRLLGFRSDWTPPTTSHEITFTNLNPGRYRLEVKAANNWGTWSEKPATLDIVVLPPWWRTWWAYTLYLLLVIGSSVGYVYSLKRKIEREKEVSASLREANEIKSNFVEKLQTQVVAATRELRDTLQGVNLKNAELEIAQKRATEGEQVKSQFLAHMSHELRTPLTGILGFTKLLTSTALSSEQKDYVGTIHQSSETLLAIINDTLDLSKLDAGKLLIDEIDFDLLEVIESTLELLAPIAYQKRLELVRVIPPDMPLQLRGDPLRLRQVLTNLLSNAIKFTESGAVAIQTAVVSEDEREVALSVTVSDTGIGISETELPQLFHAYARSRISTRQHVEGTGLGLAICKKLLDLMGGTIQVKSRVGSGTSFEFTLKFKLQKNAPTRVKLPKKLDILLYDRHPLSCLAWRASLTRLGAEVHEVADLEALMALKADAAVLALSERELAHLGELRQRFSPALPPMLILAPRIERQALRDLSEALYHRVLSKSAREKTVYLELQSLVQAAVQVEPGSEATRKTARIVPNLDAPLVLVADDNRINRRLLVTMLNHAGFRTAEAGNGHELLDLAARGSWDAALLDIHMPGMDGIETASQLRSVYGDKVPPIIAMSADVMPETRNQIRQGVMDDFLMKPFNEQQLVDLLRQHMDRYARRRRSTAQ